MISFNIGFVTNSSSAVHHFPKQLMDDPLVKKFMELFDLGPGKSVVGKRFFDRSGCSSIAFDTEAKTRIEARMREEGEGYRDIGFEPDLPPVQTEDPDDIVVIYGDEYESLASQFAELLREAAKRLGVETKKYEFN